MPKIYKDAVGKEYSYDDLIKTIGTPEGADSFIKRKGMKLKPQVDVFNKTRSLALGDLGKEDKPIVEEPVVEKPKPVIKTEPTSVFNKTVKKPVTLIPEIKPIKPTKPADPLGFSNLEPNKLFQPKPVTPKYNIDYNDLIDKPTDYVKSSLQKKVGDDYVVSISSTGTKDYQNGIVNTAVIKSKKTGEATSFVVPRTLTKQTAVGPLSSIENAPTEFDRLHINGFLNENSTDSKLYKTTGIPKSMVSKMHLTKEGDKPMNDDEKADDLMNNRIPSLKGYLVNNLPKLVDESIGATQSYNKAIGDPESLEKIKDYISKDKNISEIYGVDKSYTDIIVSKYLQKLAKDEKAKLDDTTSEYMSTLPNAPKYFREQFAKEQTDPKLQTLAQKSNGLESIKTNLYELEQQALTGKKVDVIAQANLKTQLGLQEKEFNKLQKEAFGPDTKFYINNSDFSHVPESKVTTKDPSKVSDISKDVHTALSLYAGTPREGLQRAWIDVNKKWYGIKKHAEEKINVVIPGIKYGDEGTYRLLDIKTNAIANGGEVMYNKSGEMIVKNVPRKVIDTWGTGMEIFSFKGGKKAENIDNDLNEWSQYSKGVVADRTALGYLNVFNVKPESIDLGFKESGKNFVKALGNELFKTFAPKDYRTGEVSEGFKIETNRTLADNISKVVDINRLKIDEKDKKHLEKNLGEVISQTTTGIIPVVVELGMVEAATEGLGTIGALTTAGGKVAKLWEAYKVGSTWQKGIYHTTKIVWEEAKMQGVLGAKAGSGAGFYIGGKLARFSPLNLSSRWRMINNVVNTGLSAGIGGVAGGKIGGMLEGAVSDITGQQEYSEFIKEHYGTLTGDTKQNIADIIVFGALGISHLKSNDLKSIGSINASVNEVQGKMLTLNKEVNDLFNMQQNLDPKSTEHKDIQKQIDANQEKYNDYQSALDPLKQIQRNEDLRYTLARDDKKLAAYLSSVSSTALETINKQEENKLNPVTFTIKSLGNGVTSSYDAKTKEIVINKDRLYGQDPFTGAYDYLQLGVIPHEVLHAMGTAMFPKVEVLDADGKPAKDKNGEPIMRDDYGKWNGFADMVMSSAENPLHRPLTQEEDITFEQGVERAYSDTTENVRNTPEEKVAWTMQRLQDQNVDTYSLMKDVKQDIVGWWERKTGRGPVINNGKDLLDFLDRMNRSVLNSKNAEKQYEKFRDIDISDFTINNEILSNIDKQIIAEKGGEPVRKESINIIQDYVRKNNPRGLDTETSKDLMEDLRTKIEDYWGKVPDHQVKLMYQNIDHAEDVIENRSLEKGSIYQIANKGLNLALVKNVEQRLNNFINLAERNRIQPDQPSVKESKDLESLTKEKDALKNANIAMARREGGMTDADRETAKENYNRILEINKEIERVGLPAGNEKISDANVKASNRNKELISIIKDPETKAGSLQKATDALLENNMGAIQKLVKSKFDTLREEGAMTKEDLLQNVKIDFLNLVRTFDPAKNDNFGAYMAPLLKRRIAAHFAEASIIKTKVSKSGMDKELKSILTPEQLRKVRDIEEDAKDYGLSPEEVTSEIKDLLTDEQLDEWNAIEDKYQEKVYTDSLSGEFAPDLMDTTAEHDFEIVDRDIHDEKVQLHKDLELDENVMKAIDNSIIKTMKEDLPAIDGKGFKIALKNSLANKIHTELLARVGRSMDYRRYLGNHWKTMFDAIPISVMTQSFRPWVKNSLDANGNKRREQTQVGLFIYEKNKVTKEEFMDYFTGEITPNSPGTLSARKKSLLAAVGNQVAYNSMIDMFANNREFRAMYENKQALLNNELADNYIAQLALKLDRETPDVKYSKDLTPLLIRDIGKILKENKDLDAEGILNKAIDKFKLAGLPDTAKKELLGIIETAIGKFIDAGNSALVTKKAPKKVTKDTVKVDKVLKQNESAGWLSALSNVDNIKGNNIKTITKAVNIIANNIAKNLGITSRKYRDRLKVQLVDENSTVKQAINRSMRSQELGFANDKQVVVLYQDKPVQEHVPSKKFLTNFDDNLFKNKDWYSKVLQLSEVQDGFGAGKSGRPQLHTLRSAQEVHNEIESRIEEIENNILDGGEYFLNNISDATINSQIAFHKKARDGRQYHQWTKIRDDVNFKNDYITEIQNMQIEALNTNIFDQLYNQGLPIEFRYLAINEMIKHDYVFTTDGNIVRTSSKKSDLQKSLNIFKRVKGDILAKTYAENSNSGRSLGEEYLKNLRDDMVNNAVIDRFPERKRHEIPEGIWYEFKQSDKAEDIDDLYELANTTQITQGGWCTGADIGTAAEHIGGGDFWVLTDKKTKQAILAVRYEDTYLWEIRGIGKGQAIRNSETPVLDHIVSKFDGGKSYASVVKWRTAINDFILEPESYKKLVFSDAVDLMLSDGDTTEIGNGEDVDLNVDNSFKEKIASLFSNEEWLATSGYKLSDVYITDKDTGIAKPGQDDIFKAKLVIGDVKIPFTSTKGNIMELPNLEKHLGLELTFNDVNNDIFLPNLTESGSLNIYYKNNSKFGTIHLGKDLKAGNLTIVNKGTEFNSINSFKPIEGNISTNSVSIRYNNTLFKNIDLSNISYSRINLENLISKNIILNDKASDITLDFSDLERTRIDEMTGKPRGSGIKAMIDSAKSGISITGPNDINSINIISDTNIPISMPSTDSIKKLALYGDSQYFELTKELSEKVGKVYDSRFVDETLYQGDRGAIIKSATKSLILLSKTNADVTTIFHELGHEWERVLKDYEVKTIEKWSGKKSGTVAYSEAFAKGFEKYIYEGTSGDTKPDGVFKKLTMLFKKAISNAVEYFKGVNELSPLMKDIYSRILTNEILTKGITENTFVDKKAEPEPPKKEPKHIEVNKEFNKILEEKTGMLAGKILNRPEARDFSINKGKWKFFVPPNTEDFAGMMYNFLPKGEAGDRAQEFFNRHLFKPYAEGMYSFEKDKLRLLTLYKGVKERYDITPELLRSRIGTSKFTHDQAVRFYLWSKQKGVELTGISAFDVSKLVKVVNDNYKLKAYAEYLDTMLERKNGYVQFDSNWDTSTIASDIINYIETKIRDQHLKDWNESKNIIFDEHNKNKILATQGEDFLRNLNLRLRHMETGKVPPSGNPVTGWLLGSTANIMFLNTRSALLQLTAAGNYVDWEHNSPLAAARAMANVKQYSSDIKMLWNSDYLKDRRGGMKFDLVAEDMATLMHSESGYKQFISKAATFGFKPTVMGDSIAIAFGGAPFYRNTYDYLMKINPDMGEGEAHKQAMIAWQEKSEETQQSNRPDKISNIQTSTWGKIIFSFANTSMQYNRIIKKSFLDLSQSRGSIKENVSKILYYGVINNAMFNILQTALFNMFLNNGEEDDATKRKKFDENPQLASALDGMLDTLLKGAGGYGAILAVLKNAAVEAYEQDLNGKRDALKISQKAFSISPSISRKIGQFNKLLTIYANKQLMKQATTKGFAWDNPAIPAIASNISMVANIPADRLFQKLNNYKDMLDSNNTTASRIENFLGYSRLDQGYDDRPAPDMLTPKQRLEYEEYKKALPGFTEANYMEQKNVAPKAAKENKKTWLYIFRDIKKPKDPLTPKQRSEFIEYQKALPGFTMDNYIEQKNITVDPELATGWAHYEKLVRQKVENDALDKKKPTIKSALKRANYSGNSDYNVN